MDDYIDSDNDNICSFCYAEFLDDDDLKLHITQYHLNETNKNRFCKFCSKIFTDICAFVTHFCNSHLGTLRICKYCTRSFNDDLSISKHEKKHKRSLFYPKISCSQCTEVFKDKNEVIDHEYEKHRDGEGMLLQHCYPELSTELNFNARNFFRSKEVNSMYSCIVCGMYTLYVDEYVSHLRTKKCQSYSCNVCSKTYPWKSQLEVHLRSHKNPKPTVFYRESKCKKCDKYFQITKLRWHLKDCSKMKCIQCDKLFDSVDAFTIHVSTHSQRNPVRFENCKYCRRPFVGPIQLKKHIERAHKHNMHLYKYHCVYCDIIFRHPKQLFGHFFTKHKDINPYSCKICNKTFRIRKKLTLHIKLDHKSVGFVEFDSNYHVYFTDKKSENPFQPKNPDLPELSEKESSKEVNSTTTVSTVSTDDNIDIDKSNKDTEQTFEGKETTDKEKAVIVNDDANNTKTLIEGENTTESPNDTTNEKTTHEIDTVVSQTTETTVVDQQQQTGSKDEAELKEKTQDDHKTTNDEQSSNSEVIEIVDNTSTNNGKFHIEVVNDDLVFINTTEGGGDCLVRRNKKRKIRSQIDKTGNESQNDCDSSDSDEPLAKIVNKAKKSGRLKGKRMKRVTKDNSKGKKNKFICSKCNRNCYTYQNYHRHMSLHTKNSKKICVKCFANFKTEKELNNHMQAEHSSSKLTETLKMLLDKRKSSVAQKEKPAEVIPAESAFSKTIQKVQFEATKSQATITKVLEDKWCVKKFLETFKPIDSTTKKVSISNSLSIRAVAEARTEPVIKMTKFKEDQESQITTKPQLRMPVKFTEEPTEEYSVSIKLVHCENVGHTLNFDNEVTVADDNEDFETDYVQNKEVIPEVGHKIFLNQANTNKSRLLNKTKKAIVLKDLQAYNNLSIGELTPQAPFYKIVKVNEVLREKQKKVDSKKEVNLRLPDGTKLVSVNPLAHLLNNKAVAEIPKTNKYNKKPQNNKDIREAILNAMKILEKAPVKRKSAKNTVVKN